MKQSLREYLKTNKLITDGAFGTYFATISQGGIFPERANTEAPELVRRVHEAYLDAGAGLIRTNTFATNRKTLDCSLEEVIKNITAGYQIAEMAAEGKDIYIAGDIGPIVMNGLEEEESVYEEYLAIARKFIELKADAIVFETFPGLDIIADVIRQIRLESDIFIITQFCVNQLGFSNAGISAKGIFEEAEKIKGIDALGLNCGVGPGHTYSILKQIPFPKDKYVTALPNASYPKIMQNRIVFLENMDYFAEKMEEMSQLGVSILGGCCGTNPDYIHKLSKTIERGSGKQQTLFKQDNPNESDRKSRFDVIEEQIKKADHSFWASGIKGKKLIAVELSPPPSAKDEKLLDAARLLQKYNVDVVTFPDSPSGRTRADSILMAAKVARETNLCVMPHICCRDKNAIAMRSQLLGAYISDIRNLLIITGDPVPTMVRSDIKGVFNFDSVGLMRIIHEMNKEQFADDPFYYGGAINQNRLNLDVEVKRVKKKMEQGAQFFLTQPIFTKQEAERLKQIKEQTGARILCGIMPLISYNNALFIKNEMTGMNVTDEIVSRYKQDGTREEGEAVGIELARSVMQMTDFLDGYYFSIPFNRVYLLENILK